MLRIIQNQHAGGAKSYYSTADYYTEGQELAGVWRGEAAKLLGLSGTIEQADWDALCENRNPKTGQRLTLRTKSNRTVCYDINFHAPKSVSILYSLTQSDRILEAFHDAVESTAHEMEAELKTRVRKDGRNEEQTVGNWVAGRFTHFTTRPIDGVPDCHLHTHFVCMNVCFHKEENAWKAATFRDLKRDGPYFEALFHSRLSRNLADMGLPIERTRQGWEIGGIAKSTIDKFSRRTAQIEAKAKELGINDPDVKAELGAKTRSRKAKNLSMPQLRVEWRSRLSAGESDTLARTEQLIGTHPRPGAAGVVELAVDYALAHEFERRSVVPHRQLMASALRQAVGAATPEQVSHELATRNLIVNDRNGRLMVTTRDVLAEEKFILDFARQGRGTCKPLGERGYKLNRDWLNASQQRAVRGVLESTDALIAVVSGKAGAGKTTLLKEVVEAVEANGTKVFAFAPSADASRITLREAGFKEADTVARLLKDETMQRRVAGQVLLIDEAGMLSTKTAVQLVDLANRLDARILLVGDEMQHGSVDRGALLQMLSSEAGVKRFKVAEIQRPIGRHKQEYTAVVKALSEGKTQDALTRLNKLGWIREMPDEDRYRQLATDYVDAMSRGKSALVVSPTHAEGHRITAEIRRLLKDRGLLGKDCRRFRVLQNANLTEAERGDAVNYRPGAILQFHQNAKGYRRGQRVAVNDQRLPLEYADRFNVFHHSVIELAVGDAIRITHNGFDTSGEHRLDNGAIYRVKAFDDRGNIVLNNGWKVDREFGHFFYGVVATSQKSQSRTVDVVFVGQSDLSSSASSREQFYVSCSRAREAATIYCRAKEDLLEAISKTDERLTATELVNGFRRRQIAADQQRDIDWPLEREAHRTKELTYER